MNIQPKGLLAIVLSVFLASCFGVFDLSPKLNGRTIDETFDDDRLAMLAKAGCEGEAEEVERLISSGVDADGRGKGGATPVRFAIACKNLTGLEALLLAGADPNLPSAGVRGGFAALEDAVRVRDSSYLRVLLENGADPNWTDKRDTPLLHRAFRMAYIERPTYWGNYYTLIEFGADINQTNSAGGGIAPAAISPNNIEKAIELLELGYDHDLDYLAFACYTSILNIDEMEELYERSVAQVVGMLRDRGVDIADAKARAILDGENSDFFQERGISYDFSFERFLDE